MAHPSLSFLASVAHRGVNPRVPGSEKPQPEKLNLSDDAEQAIAALRTEIGQARWDLNTSLQRIAELAARLTRANGAAIAMRRESEIVCQARAGDMAPELGAKLDANSGISGECLRTARPVRCEDTTRDARVDPDVRRQLGLWSLAAVPLGKQPNVIGILEVFSAVPYAFSVRHVELLEELSDLLIALQRGSVESAREERREHKVRARLVRVRIGDRFDRAAGGLRDGVGRLLERERSTLMHTARTRSGRWKLAIFAMAALASSLGLGWVLGYSGPTNPVQAAKTVIKPAKMSVATLSTAPGWNSHLSPALPNQITKRTPSAAVVVASKREKMSSGGAVLRTMRTEIAANRKLATQAAAGDTAAVVQSDSVAESVPVLGLQASSSENPLGSVLSAPDTMPEPAITVSKGLSGGVLVRRVQPIYPAQARTLRLEGSVVLQAIVAEDGTVHQLKVLTGPPILARAAQDAVAHWRYRPFRLNGKPIPMRTEVKVDFTLPTE